MSHMKLAELSENDHLLRIEVCLPCTVGQIKNVQRAHIHCALLEIVPRIHS